MTFSVWGDLGRGQGPESSRRSCSFLPGTGGCTTGLQDTPEPRAGHLPSAGEGASDCATCFVQFSSLFVGYAKEL